VLYNAEGWLRKHFQKKRKQVNATREPRLFFKTKWGRLYHGDSALIMRSSRIRPKSIDLLITSPPFGLIRKKEYGNVDVDSYLSWFERFVEGFIRVLKPRGSLVIDIGGAWKKGLPVRSVYHFELLLMLIKKYGFYLAQEFYWWNPSKLPSPVEWVNVRKVRVKDAVNCIWWLSLSPYPKASNRRVLQPYSESMNNLMKHGYKAKKRPSGHKISNKFQKNNFGAIPPNLLAIANTESNSTYQRYCREKGIKEHPARFPAGIPIFFISMLTDPGDTVFDPFAGSAVTGQACEKMKRKWICCEINEEYVRGAVGRFISNNKQKSYYSKNKERTEPYKIYPPKFLLIDESEIPLISDGGEKRPKSLIKKK